MKKAVLCSLVATLFIVPDASAFKLGRRKQSAAQEAAEERREETQDKQQAQKKVQQLNKKLKKFVATLRKPGNAIIEDREALGKKWKTLSDRIKREAKEAGIPTPAMESWAVIINSITWTSRAELENKNLADYVNRYLKGKKVSEDKRGRHKSRVEGFLKKIQGSRISPAYPSWSAVEKLVAQWVDESEELVAFAKKVNGKKVSLSRKQSYEQKITGLITKLQSRGKKSPVTWAQIDASIIWQDPAALADGYAAKAKAMYAQLTNKKLQMPQGDINKLLGKYKKYRATAVEGKPEYANSLPASPTVLITPGEYKKSVGEKLLGKDAKTSAERDLAGFIKKLDGINKRLRQGVTASQSQTLITSFNNTRSKAEAAAQKIASANKKPARIPTLVQPKLVSEDVAINKELEAIKKIDKQLTNPGLFARLAPAKQEEKRLKLIAEREKAKRNIKAISPDAVSRIPLAPGAAIVNNAAAREEERVQQAADDAEKARLKAAADQAKKDEKTQEKEKKEEKERELKKELAEKRSQQGMGMGGTGGMMAGGMMAGGMMGGGMMGPGMGGMGMMAGAGVMGAGAMAAGAGGIASRQAFAAGTNAVQKQFEPIKEASKQDFEDIYEPSKDVTNQQVGPSIPDAFSALPMPQGIYTPEKVAALFSLSNLGSRSIWDDEDSSIDDLAPLSPIRLPEPVAMPQMPQVPQVPVNPLATLATAAA